mmetsp:Transcript_12208/g.49151  ORF Transcript_12208/g.49151 Transcript_12208/m.49151 type:complete len:90 (+) Transcript_12208:100-369(+)
MKVNSAGGDKIEDWGGERKAIGRILCFQKGARTLSRQNNRGSKKKKKRQKTTSAWDSSVVADRQRHDVVPEDDDDPPEKTQEHPAELLS